ncbi:MAG: CBS domain-containing protein [Deltaproteobacteria bacterium]
MGEGPETKLSDRGLKPEVCALGPTEISDEDILKAMKQLEGYLDITPGDFKEIYRHAYEHALKRLLTSVQARGIMSKAVATVEVDTPLKDVADIMARRRVSGVPVLDQSRAVVGIISERDFLNAFGPEGAGSFMEVLAACLAGTGCIAVTARKQVAKEIMTTPPVCVGEDTPVSEIARIFSEKRINRVPVVNRSGRLVGIVSRGDLVRYSLPMAR